MYIGGMGTRDRNLYNDLVKRLGFEEAADKIRELYLSGETQEAAAAVPNELVDATQLIGPADKIRDRLQVWKEAGKRGEVGTIMLTATQREALELVAEEML